MNVSPSPSSVVAIDSASITLPTSSRRPKGGMCQQPFGGFDRLDRIDFTAFASGTTDPIQLLYINVIAQAANDYLYYALGRNGTTRDHFEEASQYFFDVRSFLPATWGSRTLNEVVVDEVSGKRLRRISSLTDEQMRLGCFDTQYGLAGLDRGMPFDRFVRKLEEQRLVILAENWQQVTAYLFPNKTLDLDHEMRVLGQLVRPDRLDEPCKISSKRQQATTSLPVKPHEPLATGLGLNSASIGALEAA